MATSAGATRPADLITFAHNSERQFARLLDFYLPGWNLYIEITTLNQRLVTKKNRKVRRLRELYPDVRIKVLYQRDYLKLLDRYGLEPPSQMAGPPPAAEATGVTAPAPIRPMPMDAPRVPRPPAGGAVERARAAGRPRAVPDPPGPVPPLPADPELVRLAQVLLPAERAHRRGPATAKRAG